ncbi:Glycoside hydrolase family 18 protein [Coniochaeta hoffmannii]|uniref:Glycoside hydrolase family 18 protein n=1 Tax=Coniochaeta hoffmannii TaxID=91930 RepID=A0AA38VK06_9PEZI|nr:Glycoside hydrolase family 18 protein [Coniochaeta hoffmannii]
MPYWRGNSVSYDNWKDTAKALVSFGTSIAGTLTGKGDNKDWTPEKQDAFSDYLGQVVNAWGNVTEMSLQQLFNGEPANLELLTSLIADGHFIDGSVGGGLAFPAIDIAHNSPTMVELRTSISKAFFAFAIPSIRSVSDTSAFIMESGFVCGTVDAMGDYIDTDTQHKTAGCYDGKLYYLVNPEGSAEDCSGSDGTATTCTDNHSSAPPGIDNLDDLYSKRRKNGGKPTDLTNDGSLDDRMNQDVTTAGFILIPVCIGNCRFGIQALNKHGNVEFHVGAQDIVDIISNSITSQDVEWGLY